ncbi:MAG: hypothetical protein GX591_10240 [Planctomycetes bacterium]|nr:hypothetical protein [Planctomycetota bacterium]
MTKRLLCILVATGALLAGTALGQTPTISDATRAASGPLTAEQAAEVEAFITFCTERMTNPASDAGVIRSCRVAMVSAYGGTLGEGYMSHFARTTERVFVPATLKRDQSPVVQVNGAIVVAQVARPEQMGLLEQMLTTHPSAAVRYQALKGFDRVAATAVARGSDAAGRVLDTLEAYARRTADPARPSDPAMIRELLRALDLSEVEADSLNPAALNAARARAMGIIRDLLGAHLQAIRDGRPAMADAFGFGVQALAAMGRELGEEQRKALLGTIANVAANAGEAFKELSLIDSGGTTRLEPAPGAVIMLLVYCERAIGTLSGSSEGSVWRRLPPKDAQEAQQALAALNNLVGSTGGDGDLQRLGVPRPTLLPRSPEAITRGR